MEEELDEVGSGERQWKPMLAKFYGPFRSALDKASEAMPRVKVEEATEEICDKCGGAMVIKTGRFGRFLCCSTFPECRNSKPLAAVCRTNTPELSSQRTALCEPLALLANSLTTLDKW